MCQELHFPDCPVIAVIDTKDRRFRSCYLTTSTLLVIELAFALVATTISFLFKYFLRSL
jgi:hypothetical protein